VRMTYRTNGALGPGRANGALRPFGAQLDVDDGPLAHILLDLPDLQIKENARPELRHSRDGSSKDTGL
jgi:hypothetical protein